MDGQTFGPYSAREIRDLDLLDDVLVTEERMNGQWLPAAKFDFDDMVCKEEGHSSPHPNLNKSSVNADGTVTNPNGWQPQRPTYTGYQQPTPPTQVNSEDNSSPIGWCILSFLIPLVGWILYFCWKSSKPKKASAVCTWAWIGFALNIIVTIAGGL